MAIAYDNSQSGSVLSGGTKSFTVASGSHMFLATDSFTTAVTYNGFAFGNVQTFTSPILDGNGQTVKLWELVNPTSGTHNLSFTVSGGGFSAYAVITYTGLDATQPNDDITYYSNNGTNNTQVATFSTSVTSTVDKCWSVIFVVGGNNSPRTFTGGAATTSRTSFGDLTTASIGILDSNGEISPPGNSTLTVNWSSGSGFVSAVIWAIAPVPDFVPQMMVI